MMAPSSPRRFEIDPCEFPAGFYGEVVFLNEGWVLQIIRIASLCLVDG
jgi:hypothetical protein